ncbi:MAG: PilN domain-containing protein [Candidatus Goldbacteria bacterium]|nr:PilN domain-containing protein [Candidatus Goldiibacteriota bacterium]
MIEINLLPSKIKKAKKMQVFYAAGIFIAGLIAAGLVGVVIAQSNKIKETERKIKTIEAESAALQDKIEEVKKFNALEDALTKKRKVVEKLLVDQAAWVKLLDMIAEKIYPDMWLVEVSHEKEKEEGIQVKIAGFASSRAVLADFVRRLEEEDVVSAIGITKIETTDKYGAGWVGFEFNFIFATGAKPKQG